MTARRVTAIVVAVFAAVFLVAVLSTAFGRDDDGGAPGARASAPPPATETTEPFEPEPFEPEPSDAPLPPPPETTVPVTPLAPEPAESDCGPITDFDADEPAKHETGRIDYDRAPPNSGHHHPSPVLSGRRVYTVDDAPTVERAVHNLEHGYVVVWYDPARARLGALDSSIARVGERKVFAMPWTRSKLRAPYVVTAWGHEQRCDAVNSTSLAHFFALFGGDNGDAPEPLAQ